MILSDQDIERAWRDGHVGIKPFMGTRVQPSSYDVSLGNKFRVFERGSNTFIDPTRKQEGLTRLVTISYEERFILHPGEFALAMTEEYIELDETVAARIEGKSSLGRVGLVIHSTAGWIDPGFQGNITLELGNVAGLPIVLTPGMLIGQLAFMLLSSPAERPYGSEGLGSKYQGHQEPTESKLWTGSPDRGTV